MGVQFDRGELIRRALEQQKNAYAPYSGYCVGAAVLMDSGKIYTGVNVENSSYPAGICAERNAIFHAAACGERKIIAIAVAGGTNGENRDYSRPCGVCRQVMQEFCGPDFRVILYGSEGRTKVYTLSEIMPLRFDLMD